MYLGEIPISRNFEGFPGFFVFLGWQTHPKTPLLPKIIFLS
jgi:hypothetical protein